MRQKIITSLIILIGFSGGSVWAAGMGGGAPAGGAGLGGAGLGGSATAGAGIGTSGSSFGTSGGGSIFSMPGSLPGSTMPGSTMPGATMPGTVGSNGGSSNPGFGTSQGIGGYGTSPGLGNVQSNFNQEAGIAGGSTGTSGTSLNNSETGGSGYQQGLPEINPGLNLGNTNSIANPASNAAIPSAPGINPGSAVGNPMNPAATP